MEIRTYRTICDAMQAIDHDIDYFSDDDPVYEISLSEIVGLCEESGRHVQERHIRYANEHKDIKVRIIGNNLSPWVLINGKWIRDNKEGLHGFGSIGWLLRRLAELVPPRHDDYRGDYLVCVGSSLDSLTRSRTVTYDVMPECADAFEDALSICRSHGAFGEITKIIKYNNNLGRYQNLKFDCEIGKYEDKFEEER